MAKNDYYVLAAKVLVYLYKRLKGETDTAPSEYLAACTKQFPVDQEYMDYVLEQLKAAGYIDGVIVKGVCGAPPIVILTDRVRILPAGIDFLQDNRKVRKILELLPEAAAIAAEFLPFAGI